MRALAAIGVILLWLGVPPAGHGASAAPDLVVELPTHAYGGSHAQVAPVYVDRFEIPGRVLYRFDAVLRNRGGTLDVWRDPASGAPVQGVWSGGRPDAAPDPSAPPSASAAVTRLDRAASGARFEYAVEPTHAHWHFHSAARYQMLTRAGLVDGGKVGFCFFDGFDAPQDEGEAYFEWSDQGPGGETWCAFDDPDGFVRMGLSPGAADRYASQRELQWIDVTGIRPGPVTLSATANPFGHLDEGGATANNVLDQPRILPGVEAPGADVATEPGQAVSAELSATVLAPEVPARRSGDCVPAAGDRSCYRWPSALDGLAFDVLAAPSAGTVTFERLSAATVRLRYVPAAGFSGVDSFTYTATDARGLVSPPATVRVTVRPPAPPAPPAAPPAERLPPAPEQPARPLEPLLRFATATRRGGRLVVRLSLSRRARLVVRDARRRVLVRRTLDAGVHRVAIGARRSRRLRGLRLTAEAGGRRQRLLVKVPRAR